MRDNRYLAAYRKYQDSPVRVLLGLYKGNYGLLALAALFYLIKHSSAWVTPIVVARIITALSDGGSGAWDLVVRDSLILGVLVILNVPMNYLHVHFRSTALRRVEAGLRSTIVEKLQHLSIPFHNEMQSGKLQSKIIRDVEAVQTLSEQVFVNLINITINIVISLTITAITNLSIFFFFLLTIPVAAVTIRLFRKPIEQKNRNFRHEVERTAADFMEMEEMITITRAHALEDVETGRLARQARQVADEGYRLDIVQANFGSVSWAVFQGFQIMTLAFSAYMSLAGQIPVGNVVLYQTYFTTLVNQVTSILTLVPMIAKGLESVRSIGEVLNSMDVEDYEGKAQLAEVKGAFRFEKLAFHYRGKSEQVLEEFSLQVKPGETVAFVGESGAGKTTLINLLIGFIKPTGGKLYIDGRDTAELDFRSFRRHLSVVPQNSILFSGTIRDNITYGNPDVSEEALWQAVRAASLEKFVREQPLGLDSYLTENGGNLSGGQKQRLSIARALVRSPEVIVFDEATSALDSISEKAVLEALDTLIEGRTAFIVAHRISTIRKADKICVLQKGRLAEMGSYVELMALGGLFSSMQKLQSGDIPAGGEA
ncbi:MAG: ABC transporter ATP-binding protein [Clostridiaceae bacterium]|nr:ABC transporter ATP-binding protein [Clostridiaceae bacterium]